MADRYPLIQLVEYSIGMESFHEWQGGSHIYLPRTKESDSGLQSAMQIGGSLSGIMCYFLMKVHSKLEGPFQMAEYCERLEWHMTLQIRKQHSPLVAKQ